MTVRTIILVILMLFPFTAHAQKGMAMTMTIDGLRSADGQVMVFLYTDADAYPTKRDKAYRLVKAQASASRMVLSIPDVPPGTYAAAVYHDENTNDKMDRHWYGMPKEGYGASNDATGTLGPPSFDDAKFRFSAPSDTVRIHIHY